MTNQLSLDGMIATVVHSILREESRQGCILSPHLVNLYTESVIREAETEEMGIKIQL